MVTALSRPISQPVDAPLDQDGYGPECSLRIVALDPDDRFEWMHVYGQSGDWHTPGCPNEGGPSLARLRLAWLRLQAMRFPNRPCAPAPHDPTPEFWPGYQPPKPPREYSGDSPYERIKASVSVGEVAEMLGVKLSRWGTLERGLCPLHKERTPSFTVYPGDRGWYCFGCGSGGDQITLLERSGRLSEFMEAAR